MIWLAVGGSALLGVVLARVFGRAAREADRPTFVVEKPSLPKQWAPVAEAFERWRDEGRLTREEYEKGTALLREDTANVSRRS